MATLSASSSLYKKLLLYGLGAGAAATASSSRATVVATTGLQVSGNSFYLDLNNNAYSTTLQSTDQFGFTSNTAQLAAYGGKVNSGSFAAVGFQSTTNGNGTSVAYVLKLSAGATIGSGSPTFNGGNSTFDALPPKGTNSGFWKAGDTGYVALQFSGPTNVEYGWAQLTLNNLDGSGSGVFTLRGFAVQTDGTPILAGQVPEPGTVALLVAGAAGVGVLRSRQRRKAASPTA